MLSSHALVIQELWQLMGGERKSTSWNASISSFHCSSLTVAACADSRKGNRHPHRQLDGLCPGDGGTADPASLSDHRRGMVGLEGRRQLMFAAGGDTGGRSDTDRMRTHLSE
jgi:hypothetical protein